MARGMRPVNKVRASRDGHEFHEAWVARKAMQLLWPDVEISAIAVEGLSPGDQASASAATVEIADIAVYYGQGHFFEQASRTSIVQFKYSIADESTDFRASHAKQTIAKFAKTFLDCKDRYGPQAVQEKLDFELITNRPIYRPLVQAIDALAKGLPQTGEVKRQSEQFKRASGLDGEALPAFAAKCRIIGLSGSLSATKHELASLIVDWSATSDTLATARLGQLRQMVRDKAGHAGTNKNLITREDILAALDVRDPEDLLPCPAAIANVGEVVKREQLADAIDLVLKLSMPLLIHAAGGGGKTVFMDSLASALREQSEIVFFDCFGGGAYRSPEDARHLPGRGLIHIANTLAFRGLCDPILPGPTDVPSLLKTFRKRLVQCVATIKRAAQERELALFIDAIDSAELSARERSEDSFPACLLESLHYSPVRGVKLIVSCRTERKPSSTPARWQEFELLPFSVGETSAYLRSRLKNVTQLEINVAQARSGGNPRVLDYLVNSGRGVLDESEVHKHVELDDLIQQRISDALATGLQRGYKQEDISAFLAGLAVLPPPVPLDEYASAQGMQLSEIESFTADLSPLLERTNQGLMFRDEPTETLIRNRYSSSEHALRLVATNLLARQAVSVYAARALPGLLHKLDDGKRLFQLAFDDRVPASITSTVGRRNVRYARLKAAALHAAINQDYNRLVRLLLELSTIAAVDQRGVDYILNCPDLVAAAKDVDAKRRLFEMRTSWPGTRHARLAIANCLAGELEEASRHAIRTSEWIEHYRRTDDQRDRPRPDQCDIAAIPFFLICENRSRNAVNSLKGWKDWCAYEVCEHVFGYCQLAAEIRPSSAPKLTEFLGGLTDVGPLTAALSFQSLSTETTRNLVVKLSRVCKATTKLDLPDTYQRRRTYEIQDGLRRASALALSLGLARKELVPVCDGVGRTLTGDAFRSKVIERLPKYVSTEHQKHGGKKDSGLLSYDEKQEAEGFVSRRLQPLLSLTNALAEFLGADTRSVDNAFVELLKAWEDARRQRTSYDESKFDNLFRMLGLETAMFALWARIELRPSSVERFLTTAHGQDISADKLVQIVSILTQREGMQVLAGEQSQKTRLLIQAENDVTTRASLFANLSRALMPASINDASVHFREGLDQMDAIGSGDWDFTNELLLFASAIRGQELDEHDFHRLTNICELNMPYEPEKFPWGAFARGLCKTSGVRGLAKLSRWDDRSTIRLSNTLLPYLTALVQDGKMEADVALALNRLANPVEYWFDGTAEFAKAIQGKAGPNRPEIIAELIKQFEDDNPGIPMEPTVEVLASLAEQTLGKSSEMTVYLSEAHRRFAKVRKTTNDHMNLSSGPLAQMRLHTNEKDHKNRAMLRALVASTEPTDPTSLAKAIKRLNDLQDDGHSKAAFFTSLRNKVPFNARSQYVRDISELEDFNLYLKIAELKECKDKWGTSSVGLNEALKSAATALIRLHAGDLVGDGRFTGYQLRDISDLTSVPIAELVLELIKMCARPDCLVSGAVWLAFASFICPRADDGQGQAALTRLLRSDAAKLADNVTDGVWAGDLYPKGNVEAIAAGLVWRMLGSPYAKDRWRAAHSIWCFARFGRWNIVDDLVGKIYEQTAGPFQARELTFYYLHARLWLLVSLARIVLEHPKEIGRYKDALLSIATDSEKPHVLMRHFAARVLLACVDPANLTMEAGIVNELRTVDLSPHPRLKKRVREGGDFYHGSPEAERKPKFEFHLDYDFEKIDVDNLSQVFGRPHWEVAGMMAESIHQLDANASSMYDAGSRRSRYSDTSYGMNTRYHTYGQQLGWHALFLTAGHLLKNFPVTDDWYYHDDPWGEWLQRYVLTRHDGLWLSDGTDKTPLDTAQNLLEMAKDGLALTGDKDKLLRLVGLTSRVGRELIVQGSWRSSDDVEVRISSALVASEKAQRLARELMREEPIRAWIPMYEDDEGAGEYSKGDKKGYVPWIVCPSGEARLDEHDPFGAPCANVRPRLSRDYVAALSLTTEDPFGRTWQNRRGTIAVRAQAWGRDDRYSERGPRSGLRLYCSASALKRILNKYDKNLVLLIALQRYEKQGNRAGGLFSHTVASVRISKALDVAYFKGRVNHLQSSRN